MMFVQELFQKHGNSFTFSLTGLYLCKSCAIFTSAQKWALLVLSVLNITVLSLTETLVPLADWLRVSGSLSCNLFAYFIGERFQSKPLLWQKVYSVL